MNCKPGDLAVVVGASRYAGKLVEVLHAAPGHEFNLPDGFRHLAEEPAVWVVKLLGAKLRAPVEKMSGRRGWRMAQYGCARDAVLRPLRGETQDEHHDEEITA